LPTGGGGSVVNIHNYSDQKATSRSRTQGGMNITDIVVGEVTKAIGSGRMDKSMGGRFGSKPQARDIG